MKVETGCNCVITVTPKVQYFTKYFPYSVDIKLCSEHRLEMLEECDQQLQQLRSKTLIEMQECINQENG